MVTDPIVKLALKYTQNQMIRKHTTLPEFPELRAGLLLLFLKWTNKQDEQSDVCVLATSLAQLGLDTHDMVNTSVPNETLGQARSRQLQVLAGDYFNSRFYQLLAHIGRVDIIRLISDAISEVNRLKMTFYERFRTMKLSADEFMEQSILIKIQLFQALTRMIPEPYQARWSELLALLTRCEIIQQELNRKDTNETFGDSWAFCYILENASSGEREKLLTADKSGVISLKTKYNIHGKLVDMLQHHVQQAHNMLEHLESDAWRDEVRALFQSFNLHVRLPQIAEDVR